MTIIKKESHFRNPSLHYRVFEIPVGQKVGQNGLPSDPLFIMHTT